MANTFNIVWSGPKLDGKLDYSYWETLMSTHLKAQNLWNFIEPGLQEGADAAQQRRDQLALSQIHQGVDYTVFGKIANAKSAKEAWNMLKLSYKGVDKAQKAKLQSLRREYERYEMSSSETVEQYFTRVTDLVNKMRVYGEDMPDSKVVEKILRTMPMKYDHVVTTILESHDMDTMTIAELQGTMESHSSRILEKSEKSIEEALKSRVNFNNVAESSHDSVKLLLKFGNSTKIPIEGKGHIPIRLKDGSLSYISNVFYASELDYNLLSMGQLSEKGYKMITYHGYYTVFDNNGRSSVILDDNWLWHMRFGHFHFSGLNYLSRK
ncbi:uncharacterized protein [Arachis hypogaea]|uniref:uncharacterized protein n=1 Tax=Arachis hypogaea TaxID=3818 RepID=UPI003B213AD6